MHIDNNSKISQNFGMAFPHHGEDCMKYLLTNFDNNMPRFQKAMDTLDKTCDKHKFFDMIHSSHDDSVSIIGKSDFAGKKLSEKYGNTILKISKNTEFPNYYEKYKLTLDELEKGPMGPQDMFERLMFRAYKKACLLYARLKVKHNPYEDLPANVRAGVDTINKLEAEI